jgi:uncharacterized protein (TIGR02145 family)
MRTKRLFFIVASVLMAGIMCVACGEDKEQETPASLELSDSTIPGQVPGNGGTYRVTVTSNVDWNASASADWCALEKREGYFNVLIGANATGSARNATITVSAGNLSKTVPVNQSAQSLELSVNPTSISAPVAGVTSIIGVTSTEAWTADVTPSTANWCTITAGASGTNSGTITVNIAENTTPNPREASIAVVVASGALVATAITQAASACTPPATYTVVANKLNYCLSEGGSVIGLSGSQNGVTYALYKKEGGGGVPATPAATVSGSGAAVNFPGSHTAGTYVVRTVGTQETCTIDMPGSLVIKQLEAFNAGTVATVAYTRAAADNMPVLAFATPPSGVTEYRWLKNATPIANSNQASFQPNATAGETALTFTAQVKNACGANPEEWVDVPGQVTLELVRPSCSCEPSTVTFTGVAFITGDQKTVGTQTWSDYAKADNCSESMFYGGSPNAPGKALCRPSPNTTVGSSLFTWCVVGLFGDQLCPAGWHVPTKEEFLTLDDAVTGRATNGQERKSSDPNYNSDLAAYRSAWGAKQAHMCHATGYDDTYYTGDMFWSTTKATILQITDGPNDNDKIINPKKTRDNGNGMSVRCVKD